MKSVKEPKIIDGGIARDERGQLTFANGFDMESVKRFYMVENSSLDVIRAWHGHAKEEKYVFVVSGKALVGAVFLDDLVEPDKNNTVHTFTLSADEPKILHIPGGYANGFKSLDSDTRVIFFSTTSLSESQNDDFRFPIDYWGNDVWKQSN